MTHQYQAHVRWIGNLGKGTQSYTAYSRDHDIQLGEKPTIPGSSDPAFRGDPNRYNPEELFVSTLSSCHMLWFLHLCAVNHITVVGYEDQAVGIMHTQTDGSGKFVSVVLYPVVTILEAGKKMFAESLHAEAHKMCFIANSVNFEIGCEPKTMIA